MEDKSVFKERPLKRIPFSEKEENIIKGLKLWMIILSIMFFLFSAILVLGGFVTGGIVNIVWGIILTVMGSILVKASTAFKIVVEEDSEDQIKLVDALKQLRTYFLLTVILGLVGFAFSFIRTILIESGKYYSWMG